MAASAEQVNPQPRPLTNGKGPSIAAEKAKTPSSSKLANVLSLLQLISPDLSCGDLPSFLSEHDRLRTEHEELKAAYQVNLRQVAEEHVRNADVKKQLGEAKAREAKLRKDLVQALATAQRDEEDRQNEIADLNKKLKYERDEMGRVKTARKEADEKVAKLDKLVAQKNGELGTAKKEKATLESQLTKAKAEIKTQIAGRKNAEEQLAEKMAFVEELGSIEKERQNVEKNLTFAFTRASGILEEAMAKPLGEGFFDSKFLSCSKQASRNYKIPIPASDSAASRRMRFAAALATYSEALEDHIFVATYLTTSNDLDDALSALLEVDDEQDEHVRAVLFKTLPQHQADCRDQRVENLMKEVMVTLSGLVPEAAVPKLSDDLYQLTLDIAVKWQSVQKLDSRVEVRRTVTEPERDAWKPLPAKNSQASAAITNGSSPSAGRQDEDCDVQPQQGEPQGSTVSMTVIWPAFVATDLDDYVIKNGYVLRQCDIEDAEKEEVQLAEIAPRRQQRGLKRNGSAAHSKGRQNSVSFLSKGASTGSGAK